MRTALMEFRTSVYVVVLLVYICNTVLVDGSCSFVSWTGWSSCSVTCGGGFRTRFCSYGGIREWSPCNTNCFNGGHLENGHCQCPQGTVFPCCIDIPECISNPCQNGGTCNEMINMYNCSCTPRYIGTNCEMDLFWHHDSVCQRGGSCYFIFKVQLSWDDAKTFCEARNGHLFVPDDMSEQQYVENYLQQMRDRYSEELFWIGGTKSSTNTPQWVVGGDDVSVYRWPAGVPDDIPGTQCLVMDGQFDFEWQTRTCDRKTFYICEENISLCNQCCGVHWLHSQFVNSADPDETAPAGAVSSGSSIFTGRHSILLANERETSVSD